MLRHTHTWPWVLPYATHTHEPWVLPYPTHTHGLWVLPYATHTHGHWVLPYTTHTWALGTPSLLSFPLVPGDADGASFTRGKNASVASSPGIPSVASSPGIPTVASPPGIYVGDTKEGNREDVRTSKEMQDKAP